MTSTDDYRSLVAHPVLFRAIVRFNCQLGRDVHPGHVQRWVTDSALRRIQQTSSAVARFSEWCEKQFDLRSTRLWEFQDVKRRLVLFDQQTLQRLTLMVGATIFRRQISTVIDKSTQSQLREQLGDDVYQFAVKRANYFVGPTPIEPDEPIGNGVATQFRRVGETYLLSCLVDQPAEVLKRFHFKLEPTSVERAVKASSDDKNDVSWKMLQRIITSELKVPLASCFS